MASNNIIPTPYIQNISTIDEQKWLSLVRSALNETSSNEEDKKIKVKVCIFFVPKNLFYLKPEAFMPQMFAIGPYHHWVPHLYDMERYKLAAANKIQCELNSLTLEEIVNCFLKHEQRIRFHYHKYLDLTAETLAWMMAIDASFLLDFLYNFTNQKQQHNLSQWDTARIKMTHNMLIRDIFMLENQIPFFLLTKLLCRFRQFSSSNLAEEYLSNLLQHFIKEITPFKKVSTFTFIDIKQHNHLLQLLYCIIVPKLNQEEELNHSHEIDLSNVVNLEEENESNSDYSVKNLFKSVWRYASNSKEGSIVNTIKENIIKGPIKLLIKIPWKIISSFPVISRVKQPIESLFINANQKQMNVDNVSKPKLVEEISIPSVKELTEEGVCFMPSNGDLTTIKFDQKKNPVTIYLPIVNLDVNTEVILRNLVAYEASTESGPMIFTRYTEIMNGIIDTEEDVKILRKKGIILNGMKSDKEVADLWNGMSRCVGISKVEFLDKVLEDVNSYYNRRWKAKIKKFIRRNVFESWQFHTLVSAILLLLLTSLQTFCNVYNCGDRWFGIKKD